MTKEEFERIICAEDYNNRYSGIGFDRKCCSLPGYLELRKIQDTWNLIHRATSKSGPTEINFEHLDTEEDLINYIAVVSAL